MPRRPSDWLDTRVALSLPVGGQVIQSLMGAVSNIEARRYTVVRSLLRMGLSSQTIAGAYGVTKVDIAIGVISVEAFTGAAAIPDPSTDNDKPAGGWMYRTQVLVAQNGIGTSILSEVTADIRTGRKIDRGELFIVFDSASVRGTAFGIDVHGLYRGLMLL